MCVCACVFLFFLVFDVFCFGCFLFCFVEVVEVSFTVKS